MVETSIVDELKQQNEESSVEISRLKKQVASLEARISHISDSNTTKSEALLAEFEIERSAANSRIDQLNSKVKEAAGLCEQAESRFDVVYGEKSEIEKHVEGLERDISASKLKLEEIIASKSSDSVVDERINAVVNERDRLVLTLGTRIAELEAECTSREVETNHFKSMIDDAEGKVVDLEFELEEKTTNIAYLEGWKVDAEKQINAPVDSGREIEGTVSVVESFVELLVWKLNSLVELEFDSNYEHFDMSVGEKNVSLVSVHNAIAKIYSILVESRELKVEMAQKIESFHTEIERIKLSMPFLLIFR
jgi:chromosome segregation ATPase